ncbi:MAG: hypothetical protein AABY22_12070 [Nanoarchaeota archaeon]
MSSESLYVKNIENAIRAIRLGTKAPQETNIGSQLAKLKPINEGMYEDLLKKYTNVKKDWDIKNLK